MLQWIHQIVRAMVRIPSNGSSKEEPRNGTLSWAMDGCKLVPVVPL